MKALSCISALTLWAGLGLGGVVAFAHSDDTGARTTFPPDYNEWHNHPRRPLPMQRRWQLRPLASADSTSWERIFVFERSASNVLEQAARTRWLPLQAVDAHLIPSLLDAQTGRVLTLAPSARRFCDSKWRVARLVSISFSPKGEAQPVIWVEQPMPKGWRRASVGYSGTLDSDGHWRMPPNTWVTDQHTGDLPIDCREMNSRDPAPPIGYAAEGQDLRASSPIRLVWRHGLPALRDARGRWLTSAPSRDIATLQWHRAITRLGAIPLGSEGVGLIDRQGRMVIPFIFGSLPSATAQRRIRLCLSADDPHSTQAPVCRWQRLYGDGINPPLHPVKQGDRWGYQDAQGRWQIPPQYVEAAPFLHGYAVVTGMVPFVSQDRGWHPPAWPPERPLITKIWRVGSFWMVEAMVNGQARLGLMNDDGRWLEPAPIGTLEIVVPSGHGGRSAYLAELLASGLPELLGRDVLVGYRPQATEADYEHLAAGDAGREQVMLTAVRLPRVGVPSVRGPARIQRALQAMQPVGLVASQPLALAMNSAKAQELGIRDTAGLLAYACKHPGALRVATGADGWTGQLAYGVLRTMAGVDITRVLVDDMTPGSNTVTQDGTADLLLTPINRLSAAVKRGQLLMLGTTADAAHPQRVDGAPWPILAATPALRDYAIYDHFSLWGAAGMAQQDRFELQRAVAQVLSSPSVVASLEESQLVVGGGLPEDLPALEEREAALWAQAMGQRTGTPQERRQTCP